MPAPVSFKRWLGGGRSCCRCGGDDVSRTPKAAIVWREGWGLPSRQEPERLACWDAGTPRASQLVVRTVPDEQGVSRGNVKVPTREPVDSRIRFGEADNA